MSLTEADKRVVRAFVNEKPADSRLLDTDGRKLDKMGLGGETVAVWNGTRIAIISTESAKSDESIIRVIVKEAGPGIVDYSYARKGHRVHTLGAKGRPSAELLHHGPAVASRFETNGRGIYHGTGVTKNDMVIRQDHRGRFRIDLVTSAGGNHIDVTGPNRGYDSVNLAGTAAVQEQHRRGLSGSRILVQRGAEFQDYEPFDDESYKDSPDYQGNGRRTGILSDGTRINVYHQPGSLDEYTVVPHGMDWDAQARGDMRAMLGLSATGRGFSQWSEGMEGRHLGKSVPWDAVPEELKRHIEQRVVGESMVANARGTTADANAVRELSLYIENDFALIGAPNSKGKSIDANLRKKVAAGKYDRKLAPTLWGYLIEDGARKYAKEYASPGDWAQMFNAATRRQVAEDFARAWEAENMQTPNARYVPEYLQGYEDWSYEDFYNDAIDDGQTPQDATRLARQYLHTLGRLDFVPPRAPAGWTLHRSPIWKRDGSVAFEAHKGAKYIVLDQQGKQISPELRRIRGLLEWRDANEYGDSIRN